MPVMQAGISGSHTVAEAVQLEQALKALLDRAARIQTAQTVREKRCGAKKQCNPGIPHERIEALVREAEHADIDTLIVTEQQMHVCADAKLITAEFARRHLPGSTLVVSTL